LLDFFTKFTNEGEFAMNKLKSVVAVMCLVALAAPAWAASKTVTLDVPGMTCPVCPITVKKAGFKNARGDSWFESDISIRSSSQLVCKAASTYSQAKAARLSR
jgi:hypothetical protein